MENAKQWIILFAVVSVISGLFEVLVPKSSLKKAYGFLTVAILIYCLSLPMANAERIDIDSIFSFDDKDNYSELYNEKQQDASLLAIEEGYRSVIAQKLAMADISYEYIKVEVQTDEDEISVTKIEIFTENEGISEAEIKEVLKDYISEECDIYVVNE